MERLFKKRDDDIKNARDNNQSKKAELQSIDDAIERAKRQNLENRMMCGKCYLRTGHTGRNCTFESCNSARSCGDINKHPEEKAKCQSLLVKSILLKRIRKVLLMRSSLSEGPKRN